jgi:hypothetical protein
MAPLKRAWSIAPITRGMKSYVLNVGPTRVVYDRSCNVLFAIFDHKLNISPNHLIFGA